jgi:phage-related holin
MKILFTFYIIALIKNRVIKNASFKNISSKKSLFKKAKNQDYLKKDF